MTAVDTNVLVGLLAGTEREARGAQRALQEAAERGAILLCPAVYAELMAMPGLDEAELATFLEETDLIIDWTLGPEVWQAAGRAYARYAERRRRQRGDRGPHRILADFLIEAHAAAAAGRLVTSDPKLYRSNFEGLEVIVPS